MIETSRVDRPTPGVLLHFDDDNVARAQADTMKPVVIVAGVGPGLGTSIARAFGAEGFAIALLARDSARLAKRHAEITADRKSTRLNSSHIQKSRMPSSA